MGGAVSPQARKALDAVLHGVCFTRPVLQTGQMEGEVFYTAAKPAKPMNKPPMSKPSPKGKPGGKRGC